MKRTALKRTTGLKRGAVPFKRTGGIAPVSAKRKTLKVLYLRARTEYLAANPLCQWPGCYRLANDIHHAAGRIGERGERLLDQALFCALCREHHDRAHNYPEEARAAGVSFSRLEKMPP